MHKPIVITVEIWIAIFVLFNSSSRDDGVHILISALRNQMIPLEMELNPPPLLTDFTTCYCQVKNYRSYQRHRSKFLCQRRRQRDSISLYCDMMQQDGDLLSKKLSRYQKKTTLDLAEYYDALKINELLPFELLAVIKEGPVKMYVGESKLRTLRSQLDLFDKAWCAFMNSFVLWKVKDARLLGEDKVRAACQLEISMIQKCKITPEGDDTVLINDRKRFRPGIRKALLSFPVLPLLSFPGITKGYTNFSLL
ncbi:hypothetical protein Bca4012_076770 [Brassica carinata]